MNPALLDDSDSLCLDEVVDLLCGFEDSRGHDLRAMKL